MNNHTDAAELAVTPRAFNNIQDTVVPWINAETDDLYEVRLETTTPVDLATDPILLPVQEALNYMWGRVRMWRLPGSNRYIEKF